LSSERRILAVLSLLACGLLAACDPDRDPATLFVTQDVDVPVVDALLTVGQPMPRILLSRTQPPDQPYSFEAAAIRDALVMVIRADGDTTRYAEQSLVGFYDPITAPADTVLPDTRYDLVVATDRGERITASTTTPAAISVSEWVLLAGLGNPEDRTLRTFAELGDAVYDAPENQLVYAEGVLDARLDPVVTPGFQLALFSLDLGSDFVIDPPFFDEEDFANLERNGSSPVLEAENGAISLPWFAVYFEGRHLYKVKSLDANTFDLVRSTPQTGFSVGGNAGDNFERPIYNVDGGIGLFGSVAVDSVGFTILPAP
jgi:hypothetical protein